ncbi:pentatricopeptide repeat-containing protein At2g02980, chloroplastic-like [Momordica charantia]|uniref:Pentatricopeptide repeat-containing protein At2g02980, chloroplastic-like n=1 Tax=Momordica charantia TaxID=3673 RepID=A0A6J1C0S9_MOMCH|nr:pentatricopeptide repeat-containing protein At2g02980, chloroplastic-like [Momordica charantia]
MIVIARRKSNFAVSLCSQIRIKFPHFPLLFPKFIFSFFSSDSEVTTDARPNGRDFAKEKRLLSLFKQCSTVKDLNQIHARIVQTGFDQNLFVIAKLIEFCAVSDHGDMNYAVLAFNRIENPDGFLWNTMIRGFGRISKLQEAFEFYKRMLEKGISADNFTFSFLLKISGQMGSLILGKQLHVNILKLGLESHVYVRNTLIHMYGMLKDIKTARNLFVEMPKPDLVAWNTVIDCHVSCGMYEEALGLFFRMFQSGIEPDEATLVVTVSACSALGALDSGRWVHSHVKHNDRGKTVAVFNSLIDMYAKCGAVEDALDIFNTMGSKNRVTWNTMIMALATHGDAEDALTLFSKMLTEKLENPDDVTFLGVLCACNHGGEVEEGRRYFDLMTKHFNVQPTLKHYGSMVDMLGRAGFVEEAYQLIRSMPMECNAVIWRTLLAACRLHGNVKLGERVRSHVLEIEPDHSSDYVLLANMYATSGQWNEMMKIRKSMQRKGVQKPEPGNSYLEINPHRKLEMETVENCNEFSMCSHSKFSSTRKSNVSS